VSTARAVSAASAPRSATVSGCALGIDGLTASTTNTFWFKVGELIGSSDSPVGEVCLFISSWAANRDTRICALWKHGIQGSDVSVEGEALPSVVEIFLTIAKQVTTFDNRYAKNCTMVTYSAGSQLIEETAVDWFLDPEIRVGIRPGEMSDLPEECYHFPNPWRGPATGNSSPEQASRPRESQICYSTRGRAHDSSASARHPRARETERPG